VLSAYVDFCSNRIYGMPVQEAWDKIGRKFGDDGVSGAYKKGGEYCMEIASRELGLKLKTILREKGTPVGYLGRIFINPWVTVTSIQDPPRVWPKLNAQLNGADTYCQRWASYLRTDSLTPILSAYIHKMLRLASYKPTGKETLDSYIWVGAGSDLWVQIDDDADSIAEIEARMLRVDDPHTLIGKIRASKTVSEVISHTKQYVLRGEPTNTCGAISSRSQVVPAVPLVVESGQSRKTLNLDAKEKPKLPKLAIKQARPSHKPDGSA
jgi:hypothetical protein